MPLLKGRSRRVINRNTSELIRSGYPPNQAYAIANRKAKIRRNPVDTYNKAGVNTSNSFNTPPWKKRKVPGRYALLICFDGPQAKQAVLHCLGELKATKRLNVGFVPEVYDAEACCAMLHDCRQHPLHF